MKKIYYYNVKYPEYGIRLFDVKDELYLVGNNIKSLNRLVTDYNISMGCLSAGDIWLDIYTPFEDSDLLVHDDCFNRQYILCYDKEKLNREWYKAVKKRKKDLERRLMNVEEALKNERNNRNKK